MDYQQFDQLMERRGFNSEPAFKDVTVAIRPIPDMDGCPLGLYYPSYGLIVLPPEGVEGAALHELGHCYGHYYSNNLTEQYAEDFRKQYQGGTALMYQGRDFRVMPRMGSIFAEGERGSIHLSSDRPVSEEDLATLAYHLDAKSQGEPIPSILYCSNQVRLDFTQGVNWPLILSAVGGGALLAVLGALGYAVYKITKEAPWVFPTVMFGTALLVLTGLAAGVRFGYREYGKELIRR